MALDWTAAASQAGTAAQGEGVTVPFSAQADGYRPQNLKKTWFQRIVSVWRIPDTGSVHLQPTPVKVQPFHVECMKAAVHPRRN